MTEIIKLGKISKVWFSLGGYQDCCLGIHFTLDLNGTSVNDTMSAWDANQIKCSDSCEWTEEDRSKQYDDIMRYISYLLADAKVSSVDDLVGIPVEVKLNRNHLKSWRILKEVL